MNSFLAVFIGSGLGGVCRWGLSVWGKGWCALPGAEGSTVACLGTLAANVLGCLLLGFLTRVSPGNEQVRLLLMTGFCGGFTTFSTFINENIFLLRGSQFLLAVGYIVISLVLGLLAAWVGYSVKF